MGPRELKDFCPVSYECMGLLKVGMDELGLSARAYNRILKVSRTIADLYEAETIEVPHLAEAIQYRSLDRQIWIQEPDRDSIPSIDKIDECGVQISEWINYETSSD